MIGYYPAHQPGELAYSTTARACAVLFADCSTKFVGEEILGDRNLTIGGLLPNNGRRLLRQLPTCAQLTDDTLLSGSIYHLLAPLSSDQERRELRRSIFEANAPGERGMIRRPGTRGVTLRYCLQCARRDAAFGRPQIWRVVPNFPGVNCCEEHGTELLETGARLEANRIHVPEDWIQLGVAATPMASTADLNFARDVQWVYERGSADLPGYYRLGLALRKQLLQQPKYVGGKQRLKTVRIASDLRETMGATVTRLDPILLHPGGEPIMSEKIRHSFARYSLLARLVDLSLKDLFRLADLEIASGPTERTGSLEDAKRARTKGAQERLAALVAQNPDASRTDIIAMDESSADILRRNDPDAYETLMPGRKRHGRNSSFDWSARDLAVHAIISVRGRDLGESARSAARILEACGFSKKLLEKARGRLPWTRVLVDSLIANWRRKEAAQMYLPFY